jgi:drug/metabolite transporter (DMT)-like permease
MTRLSHAAGLLVGCIGSIIVSLGAVAVREIGAAEDWQIVFYRAVGLLTGLSALFMFRHRGAVKATWAAGAGAAFAAGPFQGLASVFFVLALTHTTIANAMMTMVATPILAALIGWIILKERVTPSTIIAIAGVAVGISLMTIDGVGTGTGTGSFYAIASAMALAIYLVMLRRGSAGAGDMLSAATVGAAVAILVSAVAIKSFAIEPYEAIICLFWGAVLQTLGAALLTLSARSVPAVELSLIIVLESILGPVWAWTFFREMPGAMTIVGGFVTVIVIALWSLMRVSRERRRIDPPEPLV